MEERIKSIASTVKPGFKRISDVIEDNITLNYFLDNLKKEIIKEKVDFADLRNIILSDYYLKFNKKDKKEIIQLLNKQDSNALIDYCALGLIEKEKHRYNKRPKVFDPLLKYCNNMNVEILYTSYMQLLKHDEIKSLIKQSYDINDLKAIIFMDVLMPMLDKAHLEKIINSELNPEQKALEFARQYQTHKEIVYERDKIGLDIENLDNYNVALEAAFQDNVFEEDISLLYDVKKVMSDSLKSAFYPENRAILEEYKSHLQQLKELFDKKVIDGIKIINKSSFDMEEKHNLNDNSKKDYLGSFVRKKKFESAKRELSEYHNQFNKIKELIQT